MKIGCIKTSSKRYGGKIYEKMVVEALSNSFETEVIDIGIKSSGKFRYFRAPLVLERLFKISKRKNLDFVIKDFEASLLLNKKPVKNIAIIHHIDTSYSPIFLKITYRFLEKAILNNLKKFEAIVTVSEYWEEYFKERGYKNVYKIYNSFDLKDFDITEQEIAKFKEKYNLERKPIIYFGDCQKAKGVVESYKALKDLDAHLVTSGRREIKIPVINLDLENRDFFKLLKASSLVVAMSKFKEGWCRVAHGAMLSKTPVIGSGMGGMRELLEGGKQIICKDFSSLKEKVEYLLNHQKERELLGEEGYKFAKNLTIEKFKENWLKLIKKLSNEEKLA